jgi:hypothetical protein
MTADAVALEARKAADFDQPDTIPAEVSQPMTVTSLTRRRLAQLPADTRPLPSVDAYDQLLPSRRRGREGTSQ